MSIAAHCAGTVLQEKRVKKVKEKNIREAWYPGNRQRQSCCWPKRKESVTAHVRKALGSLRGDARQHCDTTCTTSSAKAAFSRSPA